MQSLIRVGTIQPYPIPVVFKSCYAFGMRRICDSLLPRMRTGIEREIDFCRHCSGWMHAMSFRNSNRLVSIRFRESGGEILVRRVRDLVAKKKAGADRWLEIMEIAHQQGMKTSVTMMYGLGRDIGRTARTCAACERRSIACTGGSQR